MAADILMISRFPTKTGKAEILATDLEVSADARVFVALDDDEVVLLEPLDSDTALGVLQKTLAPQLKRYAQYLAGDVKREVLHFVEAPKACKTSLPDTPYLQLRHVEVKPDQMDAYRQWRDETIFDVVRSADEVETFLAYHSVISGQPGVMFVSGFSTDPDRYGAVFSSERYRTIVQQAGDQYITGGTDGLYTKIYAETAKRAA
ncbi:hypothetical protein B7H23_01400 [Notoacmeibacter marinus]|uniref:EthD domain-containing protein n=1 Tax=Notoacmeibacter marinus TaxID=1876515 RepID=A0A231V3X1_9HYPH|nr:hypothetical protein [Notoacmeibacter marinus]OXT02850.1 hypothetical protein B7H23_01400 [Notoacmeibacter marinus]